MFYTEFFSMRCNKLGYVLVLFTLTGFNLAAKKTVHLLSEEHRLVNNLFKNYDTNIRPRYNSSETVLVNVRFSLQQINDLDEKRQILKISGWLTAEWTDQFLTWNPDDYGGLRKLVIAPQQMWVPKLAIGNSANKLFDADHYKRFMITVKSTGQARWQPGGVFAIACALDMNFYPFDDQKCTIEIETWVYTSDIVNLTNSLDVIGLDTYVSHGEWTIIKTHVTSVNVVYKYYLTESFPEVYCTIYMRRKYTFYFMYILLPCIMLSTAIVTIFLLPVQSGEKVSLGVSILVAISVFLLLVAGNVPDTSDAVPIIAIYLTYVMMVNTLALATSVIVIKLHYRSPSLKAPQWARILFFHYLARAVCMDKNGKYSRHLTKARACQNNGRKGHRQNDIVMTPLSTETYFDDSRLDGRKIRTTLTPKTSPDGFEHYELLPQSNCTHRRCSHLNNTTHASDNNYSDNSIDDFRCINQIRYSNAESHHLSQEDHLNEWKCMAEVLDRVFLVVFIIIIVVPTSIILGFVRLFKPEL